MHADPTVILENHCYLECPRWHVDADGVGRVWVSDFYTKQVVSADEDGSDVRVEADVPHQPSGLGWLPDGRLLIVSMRDQIILRREPSGDLVVHADLSGLATGHINDMLVDDQGRAYVGCFGFDLMNQENVAPANLIRVDPDGSVSVAAHDMYFANGMAITGSGELLVDETFGNRVSAFALRADGSLGDRRDWASFGPVPHGDDMTATLGEVTVAADGCALAADGTLYVADALNQRVVLVREGDGIVDEITFDTGVFACGLGGADGRTLFCCAAPDFNEQARSSEREGRLLAVRV